MVANSLLAFASVNHLHYHFLYIDQPLLAATVVRDSITHSIAVEQPCCVLCCVFAAAWGGCIQALLRAARSLKPGLWVSAGDLCLRVC